MQSKSNCTMREWGDACLAQQPNRVWQLLLKHRECLITTLYQAARPDSDPDATTLRRQQMRIGAIVSTINRTLPIGFRIKTGEKRFSYRLVIDAE